MKSFIVVLSLLVACVLAEGVAVQEAMSSSHTTVTPAQDAIDRYWMQQVINLANANPFSFGFTALIVDSTTNTLLCTGVNAVGPFGEYTAHGEIQALRNCTALYPAPQPFDFNHPGYNTAGATLYTTAESCPMCMSAISFTKIGRTVFGTSIDSLVCKCWGQIRIYSDQVVAQAAADGQNNGVLRGGVLADQSDPLFANFCPSSKDCSTAANPR